MLYILSFLCYLFALVDYGLSVFGVDITGVSWSPLVAGGLGVIFGAVAKGMADSEKKEEEQTQSAAKPDAE